MFLADQFLHEWEDLQHTPPHTHLHANEENSLMNWRPLLTSSCAGRRTYNIHLHRCTCMWMRKTTLWTDILGWPVLACVGGTRTHTGLHTCMWMRKTTLWTDILSGPVLACVGGTRTHTGLHTCMWIRKTMLWIDVLGWPVLAWVGGSRIYIGLHRYTCMWMKKTTLRENMHWSTQIHMHVNEENNPFNWRPWLTSSCVGGRT